MDCCERPIISNLNEKKPYNTICLRCKEHWYSRDDKSTAKRFNRSRWDEMMASDDEFLKEFPTNESTGNE